MNQSLSEVMQNQSNLLITFDTQLKTAVSLKNRPLTLLPNVKCCSGSSEDKLLHLP